MSEDRNLTPILTVALEVDRYSLSNRVAAAISTTTFARKRNREVNKGSGGVRLHLLVWSPLGVVLAELSGAVPGLQPSRQLQLGQL